ncbi:uncharacterized protein [Periplaneta americana]|uniref:uncharacterized protein isoform X1 n=1 Tax=Periplaneta americana TaxID=6978 RepID=UPI0037E8A57C
MSLMLLHFFSYFIYMRPGDLKQQLENPWWRVGDSVLFQVYFQQHNGASVFVKLSLLIVFLFICDVWLTWQQLRKQMYTRLPGKMDPSHPTSKGHWMVLQYNSAFSGAATVWAEEYNV